MISKKIEKKSSSKNVFVVEKAVFHVESTDFFVKT